MINGAHVVVFSHDAEADRAILRDVLNFDHVDTGGGWLIFALPPSEVAMHPTDGTPGHELYLMTDDLEAAMAHLGEAGLDCPEPSDEGWGILTSFKLPGGAKIGLYQPRHERP